MKKRLLTIALYIFCSLTLAQSVAPRSAWACNPCTACAPNDPPAAANSIKSFHSSNVPVITSYITMAFEQHRIWLIQDFFKSKILPALQIMTEDISSVSMHQTLLVGTFFDARQHATTDRAYQELQAQAYKDYQPSEDFCWFGTNVRSLANSDEATNYTALALNSRQMQRHLATGEISSGYTDKFKRWQHFTKTYCDPNDNNGIPDNENSGLAKICDITDDADPTRRNRDIDYTRLIEEPRTLDIALRADTDTGGAEEASADETDVIALANNLYGHKRLSNRRRGSDFQNADYQNLYMALRSVAAKRSVAENSFNQIVAMKSSGSSDFTGNAPKTREFLAAILAELGTPDDEIATMIGERPSYYAQLEILAKKIYQNPDFFANLYDKPANVARKGVALQAIELMLDRAIYESQLRQEMLNSVLLSAKLRPQERAVNAALGGG